MLFILVLSLAAGVGLAGQNRQSLSDGLEAADEVTFTYKWEGPRFYIPLIEVDLRPNGTGEVRFRRGESEEILDCKVKLLPATLARINQLFEATSFLSSETHYQDKKDFSHLGWVTLGARRGANARKTRFNFTTNVHIKQLEDIFRAIATQEIILFDIDNAERYQPLDLPKQLELLERDLKLERIAEPERVLSALNEIAGDDTLPLIARNQARRMIADITKGKFKSPVRR
jgi:hypothetical protein